MPGYAKIPPLGNTEFALSKANFGKINDAAYDLKYLSYNVKDYYGDAGKTYASVGDGLTSDHLAIQAAINAANTAGGGIVQLPPGTYLVSATVIAKTNVWLRGSGTDVTTIKLANATNLNVIADSGGLTNGIISDLTIDGNKANQTSGGVGIQITSSARVNVLGVRILNPFGRGIYCWGNSDSFYFDCEVEGSGAAGVGSIEISNSNRIRVSSCRVTNGAGYGIAAAGSSSSVVVVSNCVVKDSADIGIPCGTGNSFISLVNNEVSLASTTVHCMDTGSCTDVTIIGNVCTGGKVGCSTDSGARRTIMGNTFRGQSNSGIDAVGPSGVTRDFVIVGNVITNAGQDGMALDGVTDAVISGNTVQGCGTASAGTYAGIRLRSSGSIPCNGIVMTGNRCYDNQGTKTQGYGIRSDGLCDRNTVANNDLAGNLTGEMLLAGSNNRVAPSNNVVALTYGTTIATDSLLGPLFTIAVTNGTAFTISTPSNPNKGQTLTYDIKNSSGGAHGVITWGTGFLNGGAGTVGTGAFTGIANGKRRTISFYYDGTNWIELYRTADI